MTDELDPQARPDDSGGHRGHKQYTKAKVRLDKWLWAARFFKTRALAKQAIEAGKISLVDQRDKLKPAKEIQVGTLLEIRQGWDEKTVLVRALDDTRRSATLAQTLYEETQQSIDARMELAMQRKLTRQSMHSPTSRPGKHDRIQLVRLKQQQPND